MARPPGSCPSRTLNPRGKPFALSLVAGVPVSHLIHPVTFAPRVEVPDSILVLSAHAPEWTQPTSPSRRRRRPPARAPCPGGRPPPRKEAAPGAPCRLREGHWHPGPDPGASPSLLLLGLALVPCLCHRTHPTGRPVASCPSQRGPLRVAAWLFPHSHVQRPALVTSALAGLSLTHSSVGDNVEGFHDT